MTFENERIVKLNRYLSDHIRDAFKERAAPCYKLICTQVKVLFQYHDLERTQEKSGNLKPTLKTFDTNDNFDSDIQLIRECDKSIAISEEIL